MTLLKKIYHQNALTRINPISNDTTPGHPESRDSTQQPQSHTEVYKEEYDDHDDATTDAVHTGRTHKEHLLTDI